MILEYVNNIMWAPHTNWEYTLTIQFNHFTKVDMDLLFREPNSTLLFIMKLPRKLVGNKVGRFGGKRGHDSNLPTHILVPKIRKCHFCTHAHNYVQFLNSLILCTFMKQ